MSGSIIAGDEFRFFELMKTNAKSINLISLNSGGGAIDPAIEMARYIRANGLTTLLDGSRAKCASACTLLFAAGTRRHYVNALSLADGVVGKSGFSGLGYHEGNSSLSRSKNRYSGQATARMIGMYYELGSSRAADLATKAPPEMLYRVSGSSALSLGLATSLERP